MKKRTIILIILIALTVFNISALITIFFIKPLHEKTVKAEEHIQVPTERYALWFRDELKLSGEQFMIFREANKTYHQSGFAIVRELDLTRTALLEELAKDQPNENELHALSKKIGDLHVELKTHTIHYYLKMKNACDPEQTKQLHKVFKAMMEADDNDALPAN